MVINDYCEFQIDNTQTDKIMELIASGQKEGAKLVAGGNRIGDNKSNFVEPTLFTDVSEDMRIGKEEVHKTGIKLHIIMCIFVEQTY